MQIAVPVSFAGRGGGGGGGGGGFLLSDIATPSVLHVIVIGCRARPDFLLSLYRRHDTVDGPV